MNLGQVYTKKAIAEYMVSLFDLPSQSHVLDPCFGGGVFVNALYDNTDYSIDAIEIDPQSFCRLNNNNNNKERLRLSLFCSDFFTHTYSRYDGIIMNPPYVRQEEIDLMEPLGITKDYLRSVCSAYNIPAKSNLYVYFILHSISLLRIGGELIVIFPNAWKNSTIAPFLKTVFTTTGYIQKDILVKGNPFDDCPLVDVCIIKFIKGESGNTKSYVLNAETMFLKESKSETTDQCFSEFTIPLSSICKIKRGLSTFFNAMFINAPNSLSEYFQPIISSPKNIKGFSTKTAACDSLLLLPNAEDLSKDATSYIKLFKDQILKEKKPITLYQKIRSEKFWYVLPQSIPGNIIFPYIIRNQPCFILNDGGFIARDNFYVIYHSLDNLLLLALLNNYYVYSQLEIKGKTYGNGLLKIQKYDVDAIEIVNPNFIDNKTSSLLTSLASILLESPSHNVIKKISSALEPFYLITNIEDTYFKLKTERLS